MADHLTMKAQALAAGWTLKGGSWQRPKPSDPKVLEIVSADAYPWGPPADIYEPPTRTRSRERVALAEARGAFTVYVSDGARRKIEDEVADSYWRFGERVETGGYLYSLYHPDESSVALCHASGPGPTARHASGHVRLGPSRAIDVRADFVLVGDWHLHPTREPRPSRADKRGWASGLRSDLSCHVGLIVVPGESGYMAPEIHAYVSRQVGDEVVCEPARIVD